MSLEDILQKGFSFINGDPKGSVAPSISPANPLSPPVPIPVSPIPTTQLPVIQNNTTPVLPITPVPLSQPGSLDTVLTVPVIPKSVIPINRSTDKPTIFETDFSKDKKPLPEQNQIPIKDPNDITLGSIFDFGKDMVNGGANMLSTDKYKTTDRPLTNEDNDYIKRIQQNTGLNNVSELLNLGWNIGPDFLARTFNMKFKTSITNDNFSNAVGDFSKNIDNAGKDYQTFIDSKKEDPRYATFMAYQDKVDSYVKTGVTQDQAFSMAANDFSQKDISQIKIQQENYKKDVVPEIQKRQLSSQSMVDNLKQYITGNVYLNDGQDPLSILGGPQGKYTGTISINQDLMKKAGDEVDHAFAGSNEYQAFNGLKAKTDKVKELFAGLDMQRLSSISEADDKDKASMNGMYTTSNDAMKRFYVAQLKEELKLRSSNKKLFDTDETGGESQAAYNAYYNLSPSDRDLVSQRKIFDGLQSVALEKNNLGKDITNIIKDGTPYFLGKGKGYNTPGDVGKGLYDTANLLVATLGVFSNAAVREYAKVTGGDQDNFIVGQLANPIISANNATIKGVGGYLLYNGGDALSIALSIIIPAGIGHTVEGGVAGAEAGLASELAYNIDKPITLTSRIAGQVAKFPMGLAKAVAYGTPANKAIDDAMGQVSTTSNKEFNAISDMLFDTGGLIYRKMVSVGPTVTEATQSSRNSLMFDYMFGANKQVKDNAVQTFTNYLNETGIKINGKDVTNIDTEAFLRDKAMPLYRQTLNPLVYDNVFNKGKAVEFVTTYLQHMDSVGADRILTADGIGLKVSNPFQSLQDGMKDLRQSVINSFLDPVVKPEALLYQSSRDVFLNKLSTRLDGKTDFMGRLDKVPEDMKNTYRNLIESVKTAKDVNTANIFLDQLIDSTHAINQSFSKIKYEKAYELFDSLTGNSIKFTESDFNRMKESTGKTMQDFVDDGYVQVNKKFNVNTGSNFNEGTYLFKGENGTIRNGLVEVINNSRATYDNALNFYRNLGLPETEIPKSINMIKQLIHSLALGGGSSEGVKKIPIDSFKFHDEEMGFVLDTLNNIYGGDYFKMHKLPQELITQADIIERAKNTDSFFTLTYGVINDSKDKLKKNLVVYILPGSRILNDTKVGDYLLKGLTDDGKSMLARYANKTSSFMKDLLKNSEVKDGLINIESGVKFMDTINSGSEASFFKAGKINEEIVNTVVSDAISTYKKITGETDIKNSKEIYGFINKFLKNFTEDGNGLLPYLIKNTTYKLLSDENSVKLFEKLLQEGSAQEKVSIFKKLFLSDSIGKRISSNLDLSIEDNDIFKGLIKDDYNKFLNILGSKKSTLQANLDNLNKTLSDLRLGASNVTDVKAQKQIIEKEISNIDKRLKMTYDEYYNNSINIIKTKSIFSQIDSSILNLSKTIDDSLKGLPKEVSTIKEKIKEQVKQSKTYDSFTDTQKMEVNNFIDKIKNARDADEILAINRSFMENDSISKATKKFIDAFKITDKFKGVFIDESKILENMKTYGKNVTSILPIPDMLGKNNQIKSLILNLFSNLENSKKTSNFLIDLFNEKYGSKSDNMISLYNDNKEFKSFIDSLKVSDDSLITNGKYVSTFYKERKKQFVNSLREVLNGKIGKIEGLDGLDSVDITDKVLEDAINSPDIFNRFKSLGNKEYHDIPNLFETREDIPYKNFKKVTIEKSQGIYDNIVLRIKEMQDILGKHIDFVKISGSNVLPAFTLKEEDGFRTTLNSIVNKLIKDGKVSDLYFSKEEIFRIGMNIVNGDIGEVEKKILSKGSEEGIDIRSKLSNLFNVKQGEYLTGTFGDKYTYMQKFTPDPSWNVPNSIIQDFYGYYYGISMGYKHSGNISDFGKEYTLKNFIRDFKKSGVKNKNDFDNFIRDTQVGGDVFDSDLGTLRKATISDYVISMDKIVKREASHTSNFNTFDNVSIPLNGLIVEPLINKSHPNYILLNDFKKGKITAGELRKGITGEAANYLPEEDSKIERFLDNIYNKDEKDGWAAVSHDVGDMRDAINGEKKNSDSFKDHLWGRKNGELYFIKSLFNKNEIIKDGKILENTVITTDGGGLKLRGGFREIQPYKIKIDGVDHTVIGHMDLNTNDFKNAASEAEVVKDEQSVALQIINSLPYQYQDKLLELLKNDIDSIYKETIESNVGNFNINVDDFRNDRDKEIMNIISQYKAQGLELGHYSDSVLGTYLTDFLKSTENLINKGKIPGYKSYIEYSDSSLKFNEIKLSPKSDMVKLLLSDLDSRIKELELKQMDKAITADEVLELGVLKNKLLNKDLEVVGYRYPVASEYNLGTYKVVLDDSIKNSNTIMHPYQVFNKIEADHDGDDLYMISPYKKKGNLLSRASLDTDGSMVDLTESQFYNLLSSGDFKNKHIVIDQVQGEKNAMSLLDARSVSGNAKGSISVVQSMIRTMKILMSMTERYNKTLDKSLLDKKVIGEYTLGNIINEWGIKNPSKAFDEISSGITQLTIDFAKSGRKEFPKTWVNDLLNASLGDHITQEQKDTFFKDVGTKLATTYKTADEIEKKDFFYESNLNNLMNKYVGNKIGVKGDLYKYFLDNYSNTVIKLNKTLDSGYLAKLVKDIGVDGPIGDIFKKFDNSITNGFLPKKYKQSIIDLFSSKDIGINLKNTIDKYDILKGEGKESYDIISNLKELESLDKNERLAFAIYANAKGHNKIFDLLTDPEKLNFLKFYDRTRIGQLKEIFGKDLSVSNFTSKEELDSKIADIKDAIDNTNENETFKSTIESLKDKLDILQDQKTALIKQQKNVSKFSLTEKKESDFLKMISNQKYSDFIPQIDWNLIWDKNSISQLTTEADFYYEALQKTKQIHIDKIIDKYDPLLLDRFTLITNQSLKQQGHFLGATDKEFRNLFVGFANTYGFRKDQIIQFIKTIDQAFTSTLGSFDVGYKIKDGFDSNKIASMISELNIDKASGNKLVDLTNDVEFKKALTDYTEKVIKPVLNGINDLVEISRGSKNEFNLSNYLDKNTDTLFKDYIEGLKNDYKFGLRTLGIDSKQALIDRFILKGMTKRDAEITASIILPTQKSTLEAIITTGNSIYYEIRHGVFSKFVGIIEGLYQLTFNGFEVLSWIPRYENKFAAAQRITNKYDLLLGQDTIRFGSGKDSQINEVNLIGKIGEIIGYIPYKIGKYLGKDSHAAEEIVKGLAMSPLSILDAPLDGIRKKAAVIDTLNQMGIDPNKFDQFIEEKMKLGFTYQDIINRINSRANGNYSKIGGGVISGSQIHRKTLLETFNIYGDTNNHILEKSIMGYVGFLTGWSYNHAATVVEAQLSGLHAGASFLAGDYRSASKLMMNYFAFNRSMLDLTLNSVGMYLKFEKFQNNEDKIPPLFDFISGFNNTLLSGQILFGGLLSNASIAARYGTSEDILGYTSLGLLERYTRTLANTPKTLNNIYDLRNLYNKGTDIDKNMSLFRAINEGFTDNNDSFLRYTGTQVLKDGYDTYTNGSYIGVLGIGGKTMDDQINDYALNGKNFVSYHDKGFIGSALSYFQSWFSGYQTGTYYNTVKASRDIMNILETREGGKILHNKGITNDGSNGSYNIKNLVGADGQPLTEENVKAIEDLKSALAYRISPELDAKGRNVSTNANYTGGKNSSRISDTAIDDIITKELRDKAKQKGLDIDAILATKDTKTAGFKKLMALMDLTDNEKVPELIGYVIGDRVKVIEAALKKGNSLISELGYKIIGKDLQSMARRQAIIENAHLLNTDSRLMNTVFESDFKHNNKDLYDKFSDNTRDQKVIDEVNRYTANQYISTKNLQKGDMSVGSLMSRYASIFKGFNQGDQMAAKVMIDTLQAIENSNQDPKVKVTKQAAAIMGIDQANYNLLKDNKRFEELSYNAKRTITDWLYTISDKATDYSSTANIGQQLNASVMSPRHRMPNMKMTSQFNNQRPNFEQQFKPIEQLAQRYPQYASKDYVDATGQRMQTYSNNNNMINIWKTPYMQDYADYKINAFIEDFYSKGLFKMDDGLIPFAKPQKSTIMLKPAKRIKIIKDIYIAPKPVNSFLLPDKPGNYD